MLKRLTKKLGDVNTGHIARSSNVPFLESVWDGAKRSRRLKSLQKGLYFNSPNKSMSQAMRHVRLRNDNGEKKEAKNAKVTVVSTVEEYTDAVIANFGHRMLSLMAA